MERKEFVKIKWGAYQLVNYKTPRMDNSIECLLTAIDFDGEMMRLSPLDENIYYKKDFDANIKFCSLGRTIAMGSTEMGRRMPAEKVKALIDELKTG